MLRFLELAQPAQDIREELLRGLRRTPKELPAKYFYDDVGSELFERICELPEYYVTRAELQLMERNAPEIARFLGDGVELIEFGCGSGRKTRMMLEALRPPSFVAIDISRHALEGACARLAADFPAMSITALRGDYTRPIDFDSMDTAGKLRRAVYFPGSTVGNFDRDETIAFLSRVRELVARGGALVIGVDLKKSTEALHAAYNDSQGVTAAFNLNILSHVNRLAGANFDRERFEHVAFYQAEAGRIEMHLRAQVAHRVEVAGETFEFAQGELVRTEISCKYSVEEFRDLGREAGFEPAREWFDDERRFAVFGMIAD